MSTYLNQVELKIGQILKLTVLGCNKNQEVLKVYPQFLNQEFEITELKISNAEDPDSTDGNEPTYDITKGVISGIFLDSKETFEIENFEYTWAVVTDYTPEWFEVIEHG